MNVINNENIVHEVEDGSSVVCFARDRGVCRARLCHVVSAVVVFIVVAVAVTADDADDADACSHIGAAAADAGDLRR
jgi:hypothetical protein